MYNPLSFFQFSLPKDILQKLYSLLIPIGLLDFLIQTLIITFVFAQRLTRARKRWSRSVCNVTVLVLFILVRVLILLVVSKYCELDTVWVKNLTNQLPSQLFEICIHANFSIVTLISVLSLLSCLFSTFKLKNSKTGIGDMVSEIGLANIPTVLVMMPIYKEELQVLLDAIDSILQCEYPSEKMHVFLSFDDAEETELYMSVVHKLLLQNMACSAEVPIKLSRDGSRAYPTRIDCSVNKLQVTISRFAHSGKHGTQAKTFAIINDIYGSKADNVFLLFVDSDIVLEKHAICRFVAAAVQDPKLQAATGLITCGAKCSMDKSKGTGGRKPNLYQYLQDCEYVQGQMFSRATEGQLGAVTCLPGALTLIKLTVLRNVAPKYFKNKDHLTSSSAFHRYFLGEDRYLTWLLMKEGSKYQMRFRSEAQCYTEAPDSFKKLLQQRRRWFLGGVSNDVAMLECATMWKKYPGVMVLKFYNYSFRGMDWMYWFFVLNVIFSEKLESKNGNDLFHYVGIYGVLVMLVLHLMAISTIAYNLCKPRIVWVSLLLPFICPPFNMVVIMYSVLTWKKRVWGGPRAEQAQLPL